jgi:hypothetical protein
MFTSAQLRTELTTDPKARGYAALLTAAEASHDWQPVADKVNSTYAGVGTVWRPNISAQELLSCIVWTDVSTFTAAQWEALSVMLIPLRIDATQQRVRDFFAGLFTGKAATSNNLLATAQVAAPTRAEELWGAGTVVQANDCAIAAGN